MFKTLCAGLVLLGSSVAHAAYPDPEPSVSTAPIGSSYYRHLAQETSTDIRDLVKFERRGFGRTEINILILISNGSVQTLKDYGNRRIKESVPLKKLVSEAGKDFDEIYGRARELKSRIEKMGDSNLPPAVYEVAISTPDADVPVKKKKRKHDNPIDQKPAPLTPER